MLTLSNWKNIFQTNMNWNCGIFVWKSPKTIINQLDIKNLKQRAHKLGGMNTTKVIR